MRPPDDRVYDFEGDAWVAVGAIRPLARELPEPATPPAPGRWNVPPTTREGTPGHLPNGLLLVAVGFVAPILAFFGEWPFLFLGVFAIPVGAVLLSRQATRPPQGKNPIHRIPKGLLWIAAGLAAPFLALAFENPAFLLGVLAIPVGTVTLARQVPKPTSGKDLELLETGDDPDICLVEVVVGRHGRVGGIDRGVAWFEGGRLLFNGHRTSFAVGGEDVLPRSRWGTRYEERLILPLRALGTPYVDFVVIDRRERAAHHFHSRFGEFRARPPQSRGPRQWPPFL